MHFPSMVVLFLFALVVGAPLAVVEADTAVCGNPLFGHCISHPFFCTIPFLSAPTSNPDTKICPALSAGEDSCCDQAVYNAITNAWTNARSDITNTVSALQIVQAVLNDYLVIFQDAINNISNAYPQLTAQQQSQLKAGFQTIHDGIQSYINVAVGDWASCARGLLNYWAGLMCFGCTPHWDLYVKVNATANGGEVIQVILDSNTCVQLTGNCVPFFTDILNYRVSLIAGIAQILGILPSGVAITPETPADVCGGSCSDYVCKNFVFGFEFQSPGDDFNSSSSKRDTAGKYNVHPMEILKMKEFTDLMNGHGGSRRYGDEFVEKVEDWEVAVKNAKSINEHLSKKMFNNKRDSTQVTNTYNSDGYPAYSNGQNSGLNTSVNSAASLFNWIHFFL